MLIAQKFLGRLLIAAAAVLVLPQIFVPMPSLSRITVGFAVAFIGMCLIEDVHEREMGL